MLDDEFDQTDRLASMSELGLDFPTDSIRSLSDHELTYYYTLLSNRRIITNVRAIPLFVEELRRRGLPLGRVH
jgi:hypothetical protein